MKKGTTATAADNKLKDATTDKNIIVQVDATDSNYTSSVNWFVGGAYNGSVQNADGSVTANQTVNPTMTGKIDKFYGVKEGVSILHEVIEA